MQERRHLQLVQGPPAQAWAVDPQAPMAAEALFPEPGESTEAALAALEARGRKFSRHGSWLPVMPDDSLANRGIHRGDWLLVADMYAAWDFQPGDIVLATFVRPDDDPLSDGASSFVLGVLHQDERRGYWLHYDGPQPWGARRIPGRPLFVLGRVTHLLSATSAS